MSLACGSIWQEVPSTGGKMLNAGCNQTCAAVLLSPYCLSTESHSITQQSSIDSLASSGDLWEILEWMFP